MQNKEIEDMKKYFNECIVKDHIFEEDFTINFMKVAKEYIDQLEETVKRLEFQDNANKMVHDYDVNMIDKVKGENVEQFKKIGELENKVKELEKENTDIKEVYVRVAKHLDKKGMLELSEFMLAQIEATPTFTTWEEYITWISKQVIRDKIAELWIKCPKNSINDFIINERNNKIEVLQELLEEK